MLKFVASGGHVRCCSSQSESQDCRTDHPLSVRGMASGEILPGHTARAIKVLATARKHLIIENHLRLSRFACFYLLFRVIHLKEQIVNMPVVAGPPQAHGPSTFEKSEHYELYASYNLRSS